MAELGRFFDGPEYGSQDFAEFFSNFLQTGYFFGLQMTANNSMETTVNSGSAFVEGYEYRSTSNLNLVHHAADNTDNRIDRVVVRLDRSPDAEQPLKAMIRNGAPSPNPVPPELIRDAYIYEISLAQVLVEAGKSYIEEYQITDEREDMRYCGPAVSNGTLLDDNSRVPSDQITSFPYGVSVMRVQQVEGSLWPFRYGLVMTVRSTYSDGFQIFKNTGSPVSMMLVRHTSLGVFNQFESLLPEDGKNANGYYLKGPGRKLECWHKITATFQGNIDYLVASWDFPHAFVIADITVNATRAYSTKSAPNNASIIGAVSLVPNVSGVEIRVYRMQGAPNFVTGNEIDVFVSAKGRFK